MTLPTVEEIYSSIFNENYEENSEIYYLVHISLRNLHLCIKTSVFQLMQYFFLGPINPSPQPDDDDTHQYNGWIEKPRHSAPSVSFSSSRKT